MISNPDLILPGLTLEGLLKAWGWPIPEEVPPSISKVLIACDGEFLLEELRAKCRELGLPQSGDKKVLCARLLDAGEEAVTEIAQMYVQNNLT